MLRKNNEKLYVIRVFFLCSFLLFFGFLREAQVNAPEPGTVTLTLSLELNRRVYEYSDYGEPPQIAVWLEQPQKKVIRTLCVTYRTGKGMWQGRVDCPVSLPYWESRYMEEILLRGIRGPAVPVPDAISRATPKQKLIIKTTIPPGSEWTYFIEVNCSADYNRAFPAVFDAGFPDPFGNGQPSIVYRGRIKAVPGQTGSPEIVGRTDQLDPVDTLITDISGITNAKELFKKMEVFVSE
jgi:hypothetical protein